MENLRLLIRKVLEERSLRDWVKEKWVRIDSDGDIAGPCGTSKNKQRPDRCLPQSKAQSLSKSERAATLAAFSDYFRYKVVAKFGGWWFDTDCFCLKDVNDFIKSAEGKSAIAGIQHFDYNHPHNVACGAFWMNEQTSNKLVDEFEKVISSLNGEPQTFGFYGPEFFTNFIKNNGYYNDMLPMSAFYAIHWDECDLIVYPEKLTPAAIKTEIFNNIDICSREIISFDILFII